MRTVFLYFRVYGVGLVLFLLVLTAVIAGAETAKQVRNKQGVQILRDSITRTAVRCYAVHGFYPESLKYLEHLGVAIDTDRYIVLYRVFASNIMPEIDVWEISE